MSIQDEYNPSTGDINDSAQSDTPMDDVNIDDEEGESTEQVVNEELEEGVDETDFFSNEHTVINMNITAAVPRLDDLIVKTLAENYDIFPCFDRIPPEYLDNVVALLDPSQISFVAAAKYIQAEKFWKRLCLERWPLFKTYEHGLSYKRLYIERHLQGLFEGYYPSNEGGNYDRLVSEVKEGAPFVHVIKIEQLLSHFDMAQMLNEFMHLDTLYLTYSAKKLGMDYDKSLFGMQHSDCMMLSKYILKTTSLTKLVLRENLLSNESIQILMTGLQNNYTLTELDLSQNKISNIGVKRLCVLLGKNRVLTKLDLSSNLITLDGAQALSAAIANSNSIEELSIRLNPLGDSGGQSILEGTELNNSLLYLDIGACDLQGKSTQALGSLLMRNHTLKRLDISANEIQEGGGLIILHALNNFNKTLLNIEFRRNPVDNTDEANNIRKLLRTRMAVASREQRKKYQSGWDEAL